MKIFLLLIICGAFVACSTPDKAVKYYEKYPELFTKLCAEKFPVNERTQPGRPIYIRHTVKGDSVPCPQPAVDKATGEIKPGKAKCPDSYRDTVRITDTVYMEDPAKVRAIEIDREAEYNARVKAQAERDSLKEDRKILIWVTVILGLACLIMLFVIIKM